MPPEEATSPKQAKLGHFGITEGKPEREGAQQMAKPARISQNLANLAASGWGPPERKTVQKSPLWLFRLPLWLPKGQTSAPQRETGCHSLRQAASAGSTKAEQPPGHVTTWTCNYPDATQGAAPAATREGHQDL